MNFFDSLNEFLEEDPDEKSVNDLWEDMETLNTLYEEMMWPVDAPLKIAIIQSKSDELKTLNKEFKEGVIIAMEQAAKAIPKLAKLIKVQEINSGKNFKQLQEATKRAVTSYRSHVIIGNFFHNDNKYMAKEAAKWKKLFVAPIYRLEDLKNIIQENDIKAIIIGYPLNMDGSLGSSAQSVIDVSKNIDKEIDVDVCLWDERLSTVGAFNLSSQLEVNVSKREKNIDQNAAAFILQGAIDYLNN